ncbi:MAG TPA: hypothetical protein VK612_03410, partial [Pyrinomonadaceae bacterium]|nr:hypothetical protein [Pyrinomonadaceae bacterium]
MQNDPTAGFLIAEAKKFPAESRPSIYQAAANKLSESGQYDQALGVLKDHFEDDALENAVNSLNWTYSQQLINKGNYDAAESLILSFVEANKNSALISLALTIFNANPDENRSRSVGILNRVRSSMPDQPENSNDMSQLFQLVSTYASIDPSEAFRNLEPAVEQMNELANAFAVVNAFQGNNVRQGEFVISNGYNFGIYIDSSMFRTLAEKDFGRTMDLIDGFSRREMRLMIRVQLLESGL